MHENASKTQCECMAGSGDRHGQPAADGLVQQPDAGLPVPSAHVGPGAMVPPRPAAACASLAARAAQKSSSEKLA